MSKEQIQKNIKLSLDFDDYVARNPRALRRVPKGASIILTSAQDRALSETNRAIASSARRGKFVEARRSNRGWSIRPLSFAS